MKLDDILREAKLTQAELAERLGMKQPSISLWGKRKRIPLGRIPQLSKVTGIPASKIRPDFFRTK